MKSLGQIAYEAYCATRDWKSYDGKPLPPWNEVKPEIRAAWDEAGESVARIGGAREISTEPEPVPVAVAKGIAEQFHKAQVVILCYDAKSELTFTTTYGVTAYDKENAAATGELVTNVICGDLSQKQTFEHYHNDYSPAFYKEAQELLFQVNEEIFVLKGREGTGAVQRAVEDFLKRVAKPKPSSE